jgi:hypothetical protein
LVIDAYLDKHEEADEGASDRLNEDLLSIYRKHIQDHPNKYAPFLAILRSLRPAIRTPSRLFQWWDTLVEPVLDAISQEKGLAQEAYKNILELVTIDENHGSDAADVAGLTMFANGLLKKWMHLQDLITSESNSINNIKERLVTKALMIFGKKEPKVCAPNTPTYYNLSSLLISPRIS